jgi:hypothetical protein
VTRQAAWIGIVLFVAPLAGCGYRAGGPFRTDVHTVYVDMVGSREFRRDIEFELTEALKKRMSAQGTPYQLAPREKADTILQVEIDEREGAFAPDFRTRQPREKTVTLAARVQWKDVRNGRVLVDQPVVLQSTDFLPPVGETERYAQQKAVDRLAVRIIDLMYEDW